MFMNNTKKIPLLILRLGMGWIVFYSGITKLLDPDWTAAGFLKGAKTFPALFQWFASPANIGWVNFLNEWALTLLGVSLILGIGVRLSSFLGIFLMILYYLPQLNFPLVGHSYIVDNHILYMLIFLMFISFGAGRFWGLDYWLKNKFPWAG